MAQLHKNEAGLANHALLILALPYVSLLCHMLPTKLALFVGTSTGAMSVLSYVCAVLMLSKPVCVLESNVQPIIVCSQ